MANDADPSGWVHLHTTPLTCTAIAGVPQESGIQLNVAGRQGGVMPPTATTLVIGPEGIAIGIEFTNGRTEQA